MGLSASGRASIVVGGSLKIENTRAKLDHKQITGSIERLDPEFTLITNAKDGSSSIFGEKWKAEVGLYDKIYADATAPAFTEEDCPGISIDLGVKSKIYLGGISINFDDLGFQQFETFPSEKDTVEVLYMKKTKTTDLQDQFARICGMQDKVLTDVNQTAALYVGKEDGLYLVPANDPTIAEGVAFQYLPDVSDPLCIRDGYGGFLNTDGDEMDQFGMSSLRSSWLARCRPKQCGSHYSKLQEVNQVGLVYLLY
ncbi:hypothetical protein BDV23DRAFT_188903 [Aspergillus alliaceus]|uniref:Uncharacterized protein n=1 Tax=Petromyces alliaceus TaxID=209559 RepID=A0A5N7BSF4_PETAA|nr:hypothetical protein BDV23DRAFT_188903 [Aspergillus alliaceus]